MGTWFSNATYEHCYLSRVGPWDWYAIYMASCVVLNANMLKGDPFHAKEIEITSLCHVKEQEY